jgi:hypothetical protein
MLIGHYGAALGLRSANPTPPLWVLFIIVQTVDIAFFILSPLGIETLEFFPGVSGPLGMDLVSIPYTHSLLLNLVCAGVILAIGVGVGHARFGAIIAAAFFSHWALDFLVHRPDLPLTPSENTKVGLEWWSPTLLGLAVELGVLAIGGILLHRTLTTSHSRRWLLIFLSVMAVIQVGYMFLPPLEPAWVLAIGAQLLYGGLAAAAWWYERHVEAHAHSGAEQRAGPHEER